MKFFLLLFFCGNFFYASAQFIFKPKKHIETGAAKIDKYENTLLTDSIPFSAIRIIDSRYDTTQIGFYVNGYLALQDSSSQPEALQHLIKKYYDSLLMPGKDTLIIQLEKLNIQDGIDVPNIRLNTAGYISCKKFTGNNNKYKFYGSVDTVLIEDYYIGDRFQLHKHGKHSNYEWWDYYLLRLFDAVIKQSNTDTGISASEKYFSADEIKNEGFQKRNKPILTTDSLKPGFYQRFSEFVNNDPGFTFINDTALLKLLELMNYHVGKMLSKGHQILVSGAIAMEKVYMCVTNTIFINSKKKMAVFTLLQH